MTDLSNVWADFLVTFLSGLAVLLLERGLSFRNARSRPSGRAEGSPQVMAQSSNRGYDNSSVVQSGTGNTAYVDQSRRTTNVTHRHGGSATTGGSGQDEQWLWIIGVVLAAGAFAVAFTLSEDFLRALYSALWGATFTIGLLAFVAGVRSKARFGMQVAAALPWMTVCAISAYVWGRWSGVWGEPLPKLNELTRALTTMVSGLEGSIGQKAGDAIFGAVGILFDPQNALMPGVVSGVLVIGQIAFLGLAFFETSRALAAMMVAGREGSAGKLARWAEPFSANPWKRVSAAAALPVLFSLFLWVVLEFVVPMSAGGLVVTPPAG